MKQNKPQPGFCDFFLRRKIYLAKLKLIAYMKEQVADKPFEGGNTK